MNTRWVGMRFGLLAVILGCSCTMFALERPAQSRSLTPSDPPLPPIPAEWEKALDVSLLPALQNNIGGEMNLSWCFANATLASEVSILPGAGKSVEGMKDMSLTPTGWPQELPDGVQVSFSPGYGAYVPPTDGNLTSTVLQNLTGIFVITWKGKTVGNNPIGIEDSTNDGDKTKGTLILRDGPNRAVALVRDPGHGLTIFYRKPDPSDPIRDIKVWVPNDVASTLAAAGHDPMTVSDFASYDPAVLGPGKLTAYCTEPAPGNPEPFWHPKYLEHLKSDPSGVLRFMTWYKINGYDASTVTPYLEWSEAMPATYTVTKLALIGDNWSRVPLNTFKNKVGLPYEWAFDLGRISGKDVWLQVPHIARPSYIRNLGALAAQNVGTRRVWFEFSNELWNKAGGFEAQWNAAAAEGARFGKNQGWGSGHLQGQALMEFQAGWISAGGTDAQLINVLGGFIGGSSFNETILQGSAAVDPKAGEVLAVTTYFGNELTEQLFTLDFGTGNPSEAVYNQAREALRGSIYRDFEAWQADAAVCHTYGVGMVAYEGGSHLTASWHTGDGKDQAFRLFLANLHKHPVMKEVYLEHWALWCAAGGRTASLYVDIGSPSSFGYWGAKQDVTETAEQSPRWNAAGEYVADQTVRDASNNPVLGPNGKPITVRVLGDVVGTAPVIQGLRTFRAEVGLPIDQTITATGGEGALTFMFMGGRPPSGTTMSQKAGSTQTLDGTPTTVEISRFVVRVTDQDGDPAYGIYTVIVDPAGTSTGRLLLMDTTALPAATLEHSENTEAYRTRFDLTSARLKTQATRSGESPIRRVLPFDPVTPLFQTHYGDSSVTLTAYPAFQFTGGWEESYLGDEFNASNLTSDGGKPVTWDWAHTVTAFTVGFQGKAFGAYIGASLDLPADATHSQSRRYGVPTRFEALYLWPQTLFEAKAQAGNSYAFGSGSDQASLILESAGFGSGEVLVRFVIRNTDPDGQVRYYLSEATLTDISAGARFTLTDFNNNPAPGQRWAPYTPTSDSVAIPAAKDLVFGAHDFANVDGIGLAIHTKNGGWHYSWNLTRFLVIGKK